MRRVLLLPFLLVFIFGCKNSVPDYSGNEKISADDFIKAFHQLKLPVVIADTGLKKFEDTLIISPTIFAQFIPDSAITVFSGSANNQVVIHPAGLIHKKERDFLLATFSSKQNLPAGKQEIKLAVFVLDAKHKFLAIFPLISNNENDKYNHSISITEEPAFILKREKFSSDNKSIYSRNGFAFNQSTNSFGVVMHDSNEDTTNKNEIINPIDTLASKNKFSGEYAADKKDFISIRDGKDVDSYAFFIHFEKNNGDCVGELKGMMKMTDEKNAVFTENADPCVINFKFTSSSIKIKEQDNCGNHRGINCPFDFTFKKKVQPKKKLK